MERTEIIGALGPTNTGKTHRAIERMLEHESGMIGLPLRLLAREVYDKVVQKVGGASVALITGEEKRVPRKPSYWVCTVEAMPVERDVEYVAVDEIQLAGHRERGHVFTERLLHARGTKETWFMGSDTMTTLAKQLVPTIQVRRFPRLSSLSSEGSFTLGSLPRRSAVVAFSARRVYEIAEKIRARKGGAAIVLGGLSPRARNAQVAMYQAGEVDYLVATDAIGMGLNLDIDRVAFADTRKFDGRELRDLELPELAQIAGRAGRHTKNGAFGTFARERLPQSAEHAIETHRFPQQRRIFWRRHDLDFSSPQALVETLEEHPRTRSLELVFEPEDTRTLKKVLGWKEVHRALRNEDDLRLLWDLCQIPDYRQLLVDQHAQLVSDIFLRIREHGRVLADEVHERLDRLAKHSGDIDMITSRISFTRTWNYIANHEEWVEDASELGARTRQLEDSLSDDLHQALLERFVSRRRASPIRQGPHDAPHQPGYSSTLSGQLQALHASMVAQTTPPDRIAQAIAAGGVGWALNSQGQIHHESLVLGELLRGQTLLEPHLRVMSDVAGTPNEAPVRKLLGQVVDEGLRTALGALSAERSADGPPAMRGIFYQLRTGAGVATSREVQPLFEQLTSDERARIKRTGIRVGTRFTWSAPLLKPHMVEKRLPWLRAYYLPKGDPTLAPLLKFPSPLSDPSLASKPSLPAGPLPAELWLALGYSRVGNYAIRVDVVEALLARKSELSRADWEKAVANRTGQKLVIARQIASGLGVHQPTRRTV